MYPSLPVEKGLQYSFAALLFFTLSFIRAADTTPEGIRIFANPVPPVGEHPRVFFTAAEAGELRERIENTQFGRKRLQPLIERSVRQVGQKLAPLMALEMENLTAEDIHRWFNPNEGLQQDWGVAAIHAYLSDDPDLKALLMEAARRHAAVILASRTLTPDHAFWTGSPLGGATGADSNWHLGHENTLGRGFAMTYDLLYNDLSEDDRDLIRKAIATAIQDRHSHGLGWVDTKLFSNHVPLHGNLGVIALCIEGEEGYDPQLYRDWVRTMRGWLTRCIALGGANHEDGYIYYALRGGAPFMVAAQRRGENFFGIPNLRNIFNWQAQWEPVGLQGPELGGYQTVHVVMNYMYPGDPVMNMFWRRRVGADYEHYLHWQSAIDTVLFGTDWTGDPAASADPGELGLKPYAFDSRRGVQIVRNSWAPGDLQFRYNARPDTMFVGHAAVDCGSFDLEALGRKWAYTNVGDKVQSFDSKDFSMVHIDGQAAGMKPPTVKNLFAEDAGEAAVIASDLTYAYNWRWYYGWPKPKGDVDPESGAQAGHGLPQAPWVPEKEDPYALGWPERDDWLPRDLSNQPDLGYIGIWQYKERINQVRHVYRTAITVRGEKPYVLIIDDVDKDGEAHLYEWYMQMPTDLDLAMMVEKDIVLKEMTEGLDPAKPLATGGLFTSSDPRTPPGAKRLLVRCLHPFADLPAKQREFYGRPNFLQAARVEEHQYGTGYHRGRLTNVKGKRLVIPVRAPQGDFKMLLFPFETTNPVKGDQVNAAWQKSPQGAEMPRTEWNADRTELTVTLGGHVDVFRFRKGEDGRTRVGLVRNGRPVLEPR